MDLKSIENRCATQVFKTKVAWIIVKTKNGYRMTMKKIFKSDEFERILTLEDGKCKVCNKNGEKTRTINKPKVKGIKKDKPEVNSEVGGDTE